MKNISFFSYKGGSGRTSLLYNMLPLLAKKLEATNEQPIIVLDMDVDSKGLTYLLNSKSKINSIQVLQNENNILDEEDEDDIPIHQHSFFKKLVGVGEDVGLPSYLDRSILFVSAHGIDDENGFMRNKNNYDIAESSLRNLNKLCEEYKCKAIIMDTPAGTQMAGDAALSISDIVITVMRITSQFQFGTMEFLKNISSRFYEREFILVPNAIPNAEGLYFDIDAILKSIGSKAKESITENRKHILNLSMIENDTKGINEVRLFKFVETNLNLLDENTLQDDEKQALECYKKLVGEIVNG